MSWSGGAGGLPQDPVTLPTAGTVALGTRVVGDANDRWQLLADGTLEWGPGNTAPDVGFGRNGVRQLGLKDPTAIGLVDIVGPGTNPFIRAEGRAGAVFLTGNGYEWQIGGGVSTPNFIVGDHRAAAISRSSGDITLTAIQAAGQTVDMIQVQTSGQLPLYGLDKAGHPFTRKQTANTDTVAANNGTTVLSLSATSTDQAGQVTFTPANALAADALVFTVTFGTAYANAPVVTLTPVGAPASGWGIEVGSVSTTGFTVALHTPPAVGAAGVVAYQVIGQ